ncbi:MAG: hypothetical protein FWH44_02435 [Methanomassiliicoccaceae archaeon]|nr:hypothetical protein [Methanomassiliicoccaceae archaeon]
MRRAGICAKCNGTNVIDSDKQNGDRAIYHRWVCLDCNHTELYATDRQIAELKKLREKGKL